MTLYGLIGNFNHKLKPTLQLTLHLPTDFPPRKLEAFLLYFVCFDYNTIMFTLNFFYQSEVKCLV